MKNTSYEPIFQLTRGDIVESLHFGAIAIVEPTGRMAAWYGDPGLVTFTRSSAKPLQALPFLENGGMSFLRVNPAGSGAAVCLPFRYG